MYQLSSNVTSWLSRKGVFQVPSKKMPRNSGIKIGRWSVRFLSRSQHHEPNLWEILEECKYVFACFVDLEKVYDRVPRDKLWSVLQEYGIDGHLLMAIKLLYCQPEVCVHVSGKQSKSFLVGVCLRQGCVLSPLFFIIYMNCMDKPSRTDDCVTIGRCEIRRLLFANKYGLQHALNVFAAACDIAGMKISTFKTEILHLSRKPVKMFSASWRSIIEADGEV